MAFVLFAYPCVELVIGDEDLRLSEPGLAPLITGRADSSYFLVLQAQEFGTQLFIEGCQLLTHARHVMLPHERRQPTAVRFVQGENDNCSLQCSRPGCQLAGSAGMCRLLLLAQSLFPFLQGCIQCCLLCF